MVKYNKIKQEACLLLHGNCPWSGGILRWRDEESPLDYDFVQ